MPILRGCCCLDVQVGTKLIGALFLVMDILAFLLTAVLCIMFAVLQEVLVATLEDIKNSPIERHDFNGTDDEWESYQTQAERIDEFIPNISIVKIVLLILLAQQFLDIIISSCLIHGIRRNRRNLMLPWVVTHALYVICELGLVILFITLLVYLPGVYRFVLPIIFVNLLWMLVHIFLVLVAVSQYQALGLIRKHEELALN